MSDFAGGAVKGRSANPMGGATEIDAGDVGPENGEAIGVGRGIGRKLVLSGVQHS